MIIHRRYTVTVDYVTQCEFGIPSNLEIRKIIEKALVEEYSNTSIDVSVESVDRKISEQED